MNRVTCSLRQDLVKLDLVKVTKSGDKFTAAAVYSNRNLTNDTGGYVLVNGNVFGYFRTREGLDLSDFKTGSPFGQTNGASAAARSSRPTIGCTFTARMKAWPLYWSHRPRRGAKRVGLRFHRSPPSLSPAANSGRIL